MPRRHQKKCSSTASKDSNPPYLAPYEFSHGGFAKTDGGMQLETHQIMHHLRGQVEEQHRLELHHPLAEPQLWVADIPQLECGQALSFFNKTVPIYMLRGGKQKRGLSWPFSIILHNYLYRKWFRPFRPDIERGQFIAKVINVND
ncbi:hypothetical protein FLAG1_11477 [Fusarium langsethiae]|uniref:Uncharacterized protein n=1 Tax=Fusarium langsethiae TaxID=179993 RepID=A0A0N0DAW7_FUSLA|nr:hypothetical protein FLAG1_11477 [Fusarium langsethiae]GKU09794.1 unnamed protein product [Fusarium langsethiae]GKU23075.1 unnamed protein product [Fusarium langsethiae]